jgi:hypothetical protein
MSRSHSIKVSWVAAIFLSTSCQSGSSVFQEEPLYKVGDTGPGGGIVVFVDDGKESTGQLKIGSHCLKIDGPCQYLEMAPSDLEGRMSQVDAIVKANNYSTSTASDWVLPDLQALYTLYQFSLQNESNLLREAYWSSTEGNGGKLFAWNITFYNGESDSNLTNFKLFARPIRTF